MDDLRIALTIVGVLAVVAVYLWGRRRRKRKDDAMFGDLESWSPEGPDPLEEDDYIIIPRGTRRLDPSELSGSGTPPRDYPSDDAGTDSTESRELDSALRNDLMTDDPVFSEPPPLRSAQSAQEELPLEADADLVQQVAVTNVEEPRIGAAASAVEARQDAQQDDSFIRARSDDDVDPNSMAELSGLRATKETARASRGTLVAGRRDRLFADDGPGKNRTTAAETESATKADAQSAPKADAQSTPKANAESTQSSEGSAPNVENRISAAMQRARDLAPSWAGSAEGTAAGDVEDAAASVSKEARADSKAADSKANIAREASPSLTPRPRRQAGYRPPPRSPNAPTVTPANTNNDADLFEPLEPLDRSENEVGAPEVATRGAQGGAQQPAEYIVLNVLAQTGERFDGDGLIGTLQELGFEYGSMHLFHFRGPQAESPVLFSALNVIKPGTLNPQRVRSGGTPGIALVMHLPAPEHSMQVFETMLECARQIAAQLDGRVCDESRSTLSAQALNHTRDRIIDFERRYRLAQR